MTMDGAATGVVVGAAALIALVLWYFFGARDVEGEPAETQSRPLPLGGERKVK